MRICRNAILDEPEAEFAPEGRGCFGRVATLLAGRPVIPGAYEGHPSFTSGY